MHLTPAFEIHSHLALSLNQIALIGLQSKRLFAVELEIMWLDYIASPVLAESAFFHLGNSHNVLLHFHLPVIVYPLENQYTYIQMTFFTYCSLNAIATSSKLLP